MAKRKRSKPRTPSATTTTPTTTATSAEQKRSGTGVAPPRRAGARYTPPAPKGTKQSQLWVPVAMFTCLVLGIVVIAGNYLALLPGGEASNNFLIIGLVLLIGGFVLSTFFR